ncbi:MAG: decaprenyl-phosphate phosphoribosyltransferase [Nanoarchaeota archaeon]|nr:decaprenyl-phosphate phosphoribosyltransferase [Nanoarchaeota archaeon]
MNKWLELIRVRQWYKNLVIFLPIIFAAHFMNLNEILLTALGFIALCLVSSSTYIINDIIDRETDKKNPEKKTRPIAAGVIGLRRAYIAAAFMLALGLLLAFMLSAAFTAMAFAIFIITFCYSIKLKHIAILDIMAIAVNFVLRAVSGAYIISVVVSPWLIICTFFLSLFLSAGKRFSESEFLAKKAAKHRSVLSDYTPELTNALLNISTVALIMAYSLYSFLSIYPMLILTLPIALYIIFHYLALIYNGSEIARKTEMFYKDKGLMAGLLVFFAAVFAIIAI